METTSPLKPELDVQVRWMIRRDLAEVLTIELASFEFPWTETDFRLWLKERNTIGMVAEQTDGQIVGYMVYMLGDGAYQLLNFAVDPVVRKLGVGRRLIERLKNKLDSARPRIIDEVRETNVGMQLFLKSQGFKCVAQIHDAYDECQDDALRFVFELKQPEVEQQDQCSETVEVTVVEVVGV